MKEEESFSRLFLGFVKVTGFLPGLLLFKPKIYYVNKKAQSRKLPRPCIFMSNHKSLMDFALYLIAFPFASIRFLMAEVLYNKGKFFSKFLYWLGGIRVDRDAYNFDFVDKSVDCLSSGQVVGIFPEGKRSVTDDLDEFEKLAKQHKPKLIVAGASAYPRGIDFEKTNSNYHNVYRYNHMGRRLCCH